MTEKGERMNYETTADELVKRIIPVIKKHPELLNSTDAWDLFKYPEFKCEDLQPSLAQASWALEKAKQEAEKGE
jgi:hypothetical protein